MVKTFHLAIPVTGDLDKTIEFYCGVLGCKKGNSEDSPPFFWCDIDFWGNELTLHSSINEFKITAKKAFKNNHLPKLYWKKKL